MNQEKQSVTLGEAEIHWDGENLNVHNASFVRQWRMTDRGLATARLANGEKNWVARNPRNTDCDWYLYKLIMPQSRAELEKVSIDKVENPSLTASCLIAVAAFIYPDSEIAVRYTVQMFPDAPGVRTQLNIRGLRPFGREEITSHLLESYAESLPLPTASCERQAVGYYNDPQHRNHDDMPIMRCENRSGALAEEKREIYDWANLLSLQRDDHGIIFVKESHKCVNQDGIDTGEFVLKPEKVLITGLGFKGNSYAALESWLPHDRYCWCWANWCVPFKGGEAEKQLSLKRFDRACFNPRPEKNVYSRSNTWGTRKPGDEARRAATQENVLKEIKSCADLAIDTVTIDDGWQFPLAGLDNSIQHDWRPNPERFPEGWIKIREEAEKADVNLHLWLPGARVSLEQIIRNVEEGGFTGLKVDFLNFLNREDLESVVEKIDRAVKYTDNRLSISWDVTEKESRLGYYFAREYGSLHTSNRKAKFDTKRVHYIAYTPRLVLRDAWHLAHYLNLNQIEIPIQDVDQVDPEISNASAYSYAYCTLMATVGLPLFFQETHCLAERARNETRRIMQAWRKHREAMAKGFVFPIGDEPCDESWTGFQIHDSATGEGYVLVFRELHASRDQRELPLMFLENQSLDWEDILSGEKWTDKNAGVLNCRISEVPGFSWLRYKRK